MRKKGEEKGLMADLAKVGLSAILYESLKVQLMQAISSEGKQRLSRADFSGRSVPTSGSRYTV